MDKCPYCHLNWENKPRCRQCGWSSNHWPLATPAWESAPRLSFESSWLKTFWDMTTMPRFFFQRLPLGNRSLSGILFTLPIILIGAFFVACHLPEFVSGYPENTENMVQVVLQATGLEKDFSIGYSLVGTIKMILAVVVFWALFVGSIATLMQAGARLSLNIKVSWFDVLKVLGYTLTPFALMVLLKMASNYILALPEIGYGMAGGPLALFADNLGRQIIHFVAVLWPYFLTLTALEETFRISRFKAQTMILSCVVLGMFTLVIVKTI